MRYLALAMPGLGALVAEDVGGRLLGSDGRADVVAFEAGGSPFEPSPLAEDVLVAVGEVRARDAGAPAVARELLSAGDNLEKALSVWAVWRRPLSTRMDFHVVVRVRSERSFLRTELRSAVVAEVLGRRRWRIADPADLELWVLGVPDGRYRLALRLTTAAHRQRGGRAVEREGALRPSVAAALVRAVGPPSDRPLLDPCCGSGTVLTEAVAAGWRVIGADLDASAVEAARDNTAKAPVLNTDARRLPIRAGSIGAVATNLPFGAQFAVPGSPVDWYTAVLGEIALVASGGPIAALVPRSKVFMSACTKAALEPSEIAHVRLLGKSTAIWTLRTRASAPN